MSTKETYDIEPDDDGQELPPPMDPPGARSVHALDICPNCGAAMRGGDTLVCLRCGYDLKTMRVVETKTGVAVPEDDEDDAAPPLVRPGGPSWLPTALLAAGGLVLVVATLAGWRGLFPAIEADAPIPFGARLLGLARLVVMLGVWTAAGMAGLNAVAWMTQRAFGDVPLALGRVAAVASIAMTVTLVHVASRFGEIVVECIGATLVFFAMTYVLFRLPPKLAMQAAFFALMALVTVVLGARLVVWAM